MKISGDDYRMLEERPDVALLYCDCSRDRDDCNTISVPDQWGCSICGTLKTTWRKLMDRRRAKWGPDAPWQNEDGG